jgi:hypothetical protein
LDHLPVLIDTTYLSSSQNLQDLPDFTRMDWAAFQACLEDRLQGNSAVNDEEAVDKCVGKLISTIQEVIAASSSKRRHSADPRSPIPASIQEETRLKKLFEAAVASYEGPRSESPDKPPPVVGDLSA